MLRVCYALNINCLRPKQNNMCPLTMGGAVATCLEWCVTLWLSEEWKEDLYECIVTIHRNDLVYPWITLNFRKMERRKDSMRHCEYNNDPFFSSQDQEDDELNDRILVDRMSHLSMVYWLGMLRSLRLRTCPKSLILPTLHGQGRVNASTVRADWQFLWNTMHMSRNHLCSVFHLMHPPRYLTHWQAKLAF